MRYIEVLDAVLRGRGQREGNVIERAIPGPTPVVEVGAYYIGPYDSLMWVEGLLWIAPEGAIPLSTKWGFLTNAARGFTRLIPDVGIALLTTVLLGRLTEGARS